MLDYPGRPQRIGLMVVALLLGLLTTTARADPAEQQQALVAVATNFLPTAQRLQRRYEAASGQRLRLAAGSTGKLYAQIRHGAPYDLFLAADRARPEQLEQRGLGVPNSRITYAVGALVLWSPTVGQVDADGASTLRNARFRRLAMANPALAPYGVAAAQTLTHLQLLRSLSAKIVRGENVGQAFAMVASGNAELGFVAAANVAQQPGGSRWLVPADHHAPIEQQAVLLQRGTDNAAARGFLSFLRSSSAQQLIAADGYRTYVEP